MKHKWLVATVAAGIFMMYVCISLFTYHYDSLDKMVQNGADGSINTFTAIKVFGINEPMTNPFGFILLLFGALLLWVMLCLAIYYVIVKALSKSAN